MVGIVKQRRRCDKDVTKRNFFVAAEWPMIRMRVKCHAPGWFV